MCTCTCASLNANLSHVCKLFGNALFLHKPLVIHVCFQCLDAFTTSEQYTTCGRVKECEQRAFKEIIYKNLASCNVVRNYVTAFTNTLFFRGLEQPVSSTACMQSIARLLHKEVCTKLPDYLSYEYGLHDTVEHDHVLPSNGLQKPLSPRVSMKITTRLSYKQACYKIAGCNLVDTWLG